MDVETAYLLADEVELGTPLEAAAESLGLKRATVYQWLQIGDQDEPGNWPSGGAVDPETWQTAKVFSEAIMQARARREVALVKVALLATEEGTKENAVRSKAALDLLSRHTAYRDRWGQQLQVQHTGAPLAPTIQVLNVSGSEAREFAKARRAQELAEGTNSRSGIAALPSANPAD